MAKAPSARREPPRAQSVGEKFVEMTTRPVRSLIVALAVPAVISNLVTTIYNLADTFFIGQISTSASGAIGIAYAMMTLIQAIGFFFGQGTGNAISRELGRKHVEEARVIASTGLAATLVAGTFVAVAGNLLIVPLCKLAGATDTILPYAVTYMGLILTGAPWMAASLVLSNQLRFEGSSTIAMVGLVTGSVVNFGLAPLLIFACGMGIAGAGLATIVCQGISFVVLVVANQRLGTVRLSLARVRPSGRFFATVVNGGIPSFFRQVVFAFATICLNTAAAPYGDAAIAAVAIVMRVVSIGNCIQIGLGQGFQPVCGFNYGAAIYRRVRAGYLFSVKAAMAVLAGLCVLAFAFAPQIVGFFRNDPEVIAIGTATLRFQCFSLPFTGVAMLTNFMLQTTGKVWRATFLGVARLGIFLAPTVIVLSSALGVQGIEMAQTVSDGITLLVAVPMAASLLGELGRLQRQTDATRRADVQRAVAAYVAAEEAGEHVVVIDA